MSRSGTFRTWRNVRFESAFGSKAENICSQRVFSPFDPLRTFVRGLWTDLYRVEDYPSYLAASRSDASAQKAPTILSSTASASLVPAVSPFSKSSPDCPIVFVTWARQRTRTPAALAKV